MTEWQSLKVGDYRSRLLEVKISQIDTFMLNGHLRQTITIIPSEKLVILRMGMTREDIGFSNAKLLRTIAAVRF